MCRADSRPTTKGYKIPHGPRRFPSLWPENFCVFSPNVGVSVHQVAVAVHDVAFGAEDGLVAVFPTADGKADVFYAGTNGLEADRVETMA
jgi:hypothetical protein